MADSEQRDAAADAALKAPAKRLTGPVLTPALERMFGALCDEPPGGLAALTSQDAPAPVGDDGRGSGAKGPPDTGAGGAARSRSGERVTTGSEQHDAAAGPVPRAPAKRSVGVGLTPAVERQFGILAEDRPDDATQPAVEPEARRTAQPGAA